MASELRGRADTARANPSSVERLFARELQQLREIGFAEGLPLSDAIDAGDALRLECGSMGVAVEFSVREHERHTFRIVSLAPHDYAAAPYASNRWRDIMMVLHSRVRSIDND